MAWISEKVCVWCTIKHWFESVWLYIQSLYQLRYFFGLYWICLTLTHRRSSQLQLQLPTEGSRKKVMKINWGSLHGFCWNQYGSFKVSFYTTPIKFLFSGGLLQFLAKNVFVSSSVDPAPMDCFPINVFFTSQLEFLDQHIYPGWKMTHSKIATNAT